MFMFELINFEIQFFCSFKLVLIPVFAFEDKDWKYSASNHDTDKDTHPRMMAGSWLGNKIRPVMNNHPFGYTIFCMLIGVVVVVGFACFFQMVRIRVNRAPSTTSVPSFTK